MYSGVERKFRRAGGGTPYDDGHNTNHISPGTVGRVTLDALSLGGSKFRRAGGGTPYDDDGHNTNHMSPGTVGRVALDALSLGGT